MITLTLPIQFAPTHVNVYIATAHLQETEVEKNLANPQTYSLYSQLSDDNILHDSEV